MPSVFESLRARTTPGQRRVGSALALVAAVWIGAAQLRGKVVRAVEVHVPLAALSSGGEVRAVRLRFSRGAEAVCEVSQRWPVAPREMVATVSLPEGPCDAEIMVERGGRVLTRAARLEVRAGEPLAVPAPTD